MEKGFRAGVLYQVLYWFNDIVYPGKLEHGFWRINTGIPYTLP